jgi:hypothetical protein
MAWAKTLDLVRKIKQNKNSGLGHSSSGAVAA